MRVCKKNVASYRFELQPVKCQKRNGQSGNPPNPPISRLWLHVSLFQRRVSNSLLHGNIEIKGTRGEHTVPGGSAGPANSDLRSTVLSLE